MATVESLAADPALTGKALDDYAAEELHRDMKPKPSFATIDDAVSHIDHAITVAGIDHVGIGSDFDGISSPPKGLEDISKMPALKAALKRQGYSDEDLKKIFGGNVLRVLREVTGSKGSGGAGIGRLLRVHAKAGLLGRRGCGGRRCFRGHLAAMAGVAGDMFLGIREFAVDVADHGDHHTGHVLFRIVVAGPVAALHMAVIAGDAEGLSILAHHAGPQIFRLQEFQILRRTSACFLGSLLRRLGA